MPRGEKGFGTWPKDVLKAFSSRAGRKSQATGRGRRFAPGDALTIKAAGMGGDAVRESQAACVHELRPAEATMTGTKKGDKRCHKCWRYFTAPKAGVR
jgi:hypothetical protein